MFNGERWSEPSYILDMKTGQKSTLSDAVGNIHVSPDLTRLAYQGYHAPSNSKHLAIAGNDGQVLLTIPWETSWRHIAGWLNNEQLWISRKQGTDPYANNDSLIILNPFTGQQQDLLATYSGFVNVYPGPGWGWFNPSSTIYDSTLSRVIFPGGFSQLILWNMQDSHALATISGTISSNVTPKWSPDGQHFLISGAATLLTAEPEVNTGIERRELFSIDGNGNLSRSTYLTELYTEVGFGHYTWSPNGRYVAFALKLKPRTYPNLYPMSKPATSYRFAILDTAAQTIIDYCVPNTTPAEPVWSPDGRQVVVEDNRSISENNIFVIDIANNVAVHLAENRTPVGWLVEP